MPETIERHVLIVDNTPTMLTAMGEMVDHAVVPDGYDVKIKKADSLQQADELITQAEHHWDLAIVDVRLVDDNDPGDISGIELTTRLQGLEKPPRTIVVTRFPETSADGKPVNILAMESGAFTFIARGMQYPEWPSDLRHAAGLALTL